MPLTLTRQPRAPKISAAAALCCVPLLSLLSLLYPISLPCSLSHARTRRPPGHRARRPGRPAPSAPDRDTEPDAAPCLLRAPPCTATPNSNRRDARAVPVAEPCAIRADCPAVRFVFVN
jgi:hypothetical protein